MGFLAILRQLDWPEIYLVTPEQFCKVTGSKPLGDGYAGDSNVAHKCITVHPGMQGKARENTLWHEVGHLLFPHRPEWWVYLFGYRMVRGGGGVTISGHTIDELPSRADCLRLAIRAARRMKGKHG